LNEKIELYLANGAQLVVVVDPEDRRVELHESDLPVAVFHEGSIAATRAYPDLAIDLAALFRDL
jgi:Uma2 family endonuclease